MSDSIAIVQAFAELRYGAVVHTRENSVKYGHNLDPFTPKTRTIHLTVLPDRVPINGHILQGIIRTT